ncbi:hypothetical protein INT43_000632 [Umbelopsis isabellina]|uniref:tRNA-specific adenosine deaminase 1 n=1 Tax=Mortierella isabellina TaxID=91625 RepID=A0A8H7UMY3_MORIS|nr:hypothetical protein INT43_000632 [Umbelopsis isabellina]
MFKPWLQADHEQQFADKVASACLDQYQKLPATGKPSINNGKHEWTILAGIVLVRQVEVVTEQTPAKSKKTYFSVDNHHFEISVVSIGRTGLKCMPLSKLSKYGDLVQDSHAEVIARRGFNKYLLNEIENCASSKPSIFENVHDVISNLKLKALHSFHMYISQAPCGDASMTKLEAIQSEESQNAYIKGLKRKKCTQELAEDPLTQYTYRSKKRKSEDEAEQPGDAIASTIRRGRVGYQEFGILRTKPGRVDSEPSLCMSCSDKLARWNVLGLQSALISTLIPPIYLDCVIVNEMFDLPALRRSLFERLSNLTPIESPYRLAKPKILHSSKQFLHSKQALEKTVECSQIITCNTAISWIPGMSKAEVIVNGRRQGASKPKNGQHSLKSRASICKLSLFQRFASIWEILKEKDSRLILDTTWMYQDAKSKATMYNKTKHKLLDNCFQEWVQSPDEVNMFDLQGSIAEPTNT